MQNNQEKELILLEDLGRQKPTETSKYKARFGRYKCFCGNEFITQTQSVKNKDTTSCGCYSTKLSKDRLTTHNLSKHRLYSTWKNMISRCDDVSNRGYLLYGHRGIKVCKQWYIIENFINDMYPTHIEGMTLDRIDVDGDYEPNNCRWATKETQNRNTRVLYAHNTSGYRGVHLYKRVNKYIAQIHIKNKPIHLGYFNTAIEAAKARDKYVIDNKLEHALNFI